MFIKENIMFNSSFNFGKIINDKIYKDLKDKFSTGINEDYNDYYNFNSSNTTLEKIELICNKFHKVSQQIRSRYSERPTLEINDEYDVQDLFH